VLCCWVLGGTTDNQGLALIVFDSRDAAQGFADFLKAAPDEPGVLAE
jgi:hypothetical protein